MQVQTGQVLDLLDAQDRPVGRVQVESVEGELLLGKFTAGPAFPVVEHLFRAFEEAVNEQALSVVDELDAAISCLGLNLRAEGGVPTMAVSDVQIWGDGSLSLRLASAPLANGAPGPAQFVQTVREKL